MLIQNKQIAIVGGGPGGLTLARLLQMNGAAVKVYERDVNRDVRVQGATLDLHYESGLAALRKAGLLPAFKEHYRPGADKMLILDQQANIFFDQHSENTIEDFDSAYFRPEIDRGPLRTMLLNSLQPGTVVWDSQFSAMQRVGNAWQLQFKNGTTAMADIVIGADGANSRIRSYITTIQPFYSGITAVEGNVPEASVTAPRIKAMIQEGKIFAFGEDKTIIVSAKGDDSLAFYASFRAGEDWVTASGIDFSNKAEVAAWFKRDFAAWSAIWQELFDSTGAYFITRPIYCMPLNQSWEAQPDCTILGDAAHLMPPYAGEGVNMAMQDALELSECLTGTAYAGIPSAIAAFEQQMRVRASTAAQESLENGEMMHAPGALNKMLNVFA